MRDKKAKVIQISKFGGPDVLKIADENIGAIAPQAVLIQVKAIGVNFADIFERMGLYEAAPKAPFVPGFEVSGIIEQVGTEVRGLKKNQRVIAVTKFGAYKSYVKVNQNFVFSLPANYTFEEGAGFPTTYLTAYHGLVNLGSLKSGEKVLIHAAAGGVGTAAIQLAQIFKAEIFATCGSDSKLRFLRDMGLKNTVNYREQDFEKEIRRLNKGGGVDVIMDSVGGSTFKKGYRLLNPMGRLIIYGLGSMMPHGKRPNWLRLACQYLKMPRFSPFQLMPDNKAIIGFHLAYMFGQLEKFQEAIKQLLTWADQNKVRPVVGKTFDFSEVAEAHNYLQSRKSIGKVILTIAA